LPVAIWNPRQIAAQNIDGERGSHEDRSYPEFPVTVHTPPVRTWGWLAVVTAVSFGIVPVTSHCSSTSDKYSSLRVALLQWARWYKDFCPAQNLLVFSSMSSNPQKNACAFMCESDE
jgi:hypothetical protein